MVFFDKNIKNFLIIKNLIITYVIIFAIDEIIGTWFGVKILSKTFCLNKNFLHQPWRFVTYSFLHEDFWHILFNCLMLYFLSKFLLTFELSIRKIFTLYILGIVFGGILWSVVHINFKNHILIGASAGIFTLFSYFCMLYPEKTLSILLFFIFPLQLKARYCFIFLIFYEISNAFLYELHGFTKTSHFSHIGGMLIGCCAVWLKKFTEIIKLKKLTNLNVKKKIKFKINDSLEAFNISDTKFDHSYIFSKLKNKGLSSLTDDERKWLESFDKTK